MAIISKARWFEAGLSPFWQMSGSSWASSAASGHAVPVNGDIARFGRKLPPESLVVATVLFDILLILLSSAGVFMYFQLLQHVFPQPGRYMVTATLAAMLFVGLFERFGGYRLRRLQMFSWQISRLALAWGMTVTVLLVVAFAARLTGDYSLGWATVWAFATPLALLAGRGGLHQIAARCFRDGLFVRHVAVVGAGDEGRKIVAKLLRNRDKSVVIAGVFDDRMGPLSSSIEGVPLLGTTDDLLCFARRKALDQIIVALPLDGEDRLKKTLEKLAVIPADLRLSLDPLVERFAVLGVGRLAGITLFEIAERPLTAAGALCKWLEDKLTAALLLFLLAPLLAGIALLIKCDSRGPLLFVQERFGFNNNVIRVLKFRTMYIDCGDQSGAERTVKHDPRVTHVGRFLRSLSLDELPQLINVLRGDMSLVGPRPHALAMRAGNGLYHEAVTHYAHRHRVKPGVTGWAQVKGYRGEVDTLEKAQCRVEYDLEYIANWSLWLDLKIMLMTVGLVVSRTDAY